MTPTIRRLATDAEAARCAQVMATSEPWLTLGRSYDAALAVLRDPTRESYVALLGGEVAGFVILLMTGALVGYVQTVCVAPVYLRLGYREVGELTDFVVTGHAEILMRKTLGPLRGYPGGER